MPAESDPVWSMMSWVDFRTGASRPMIIEDLEAETLVWAALVPPGLPNADGPISLLRTSRSLYKHAWFDYEFLVLSCLISFQAVEAALRLKYPEATIHRRVAKLIQDAVRDGLVTKEMGGVLDTGASIRNSLSHPDAQSRVTAAMAAPIVEKNHLAVIEILRREKPTAVGTSKNDG